MANNKVILKKSAVQGKVPVSGDLDFGEIAINYTDGKIYYKDNLSDIKSFFQDTSAVTSDRREYTGDGTTTLFNVNYSPEHVEVYVNGLLVNSSEYTATSGTSIIFNIAPANNDEISIIGYELFDLNDLTVSGIGLSYDSGTQNININSTANNTANTVVSRDASGNFSAGTITADLAGNAATATDATRIGVANEDTQNAEHPIVFVDSATGQKNLYADNSGASYNPSTNTITANITGTLDGLDSTQFLRSDVDDTASGVLTLTNTLKVASRIEHDGDADTGIDFSANTISFEAAGVERFKINGNGVEATTYRLPGGDYRIYMSGDNANFRNYTHGGQTRFYGENSSGTLNTLILADPDGSVDLYHAGTKVAETTANGLSTDEVVIGNGVTLSESTDRPDLLLIKSNTSQWGGLQISNANDDILASFMGDGAAFGIYDDENNEWAWKYNENGNHDFYHNGVLKANITTAGIDVLGNVYVDDSIVSRTDSNSYIKFLGADDLQIVTGGTQRIGITNSRTTFSNDVRFDGEVTFDAAGQNFDILTDASSRVAFDFIKESSRVGILNVDANGNLDFDMEAGKEFRANGSRVLTVADEGSGNGLDADTVDGLQASQFLRSDANDTTTGEITFNGGVNFNTNGVNVTFQRDANDRINLVWENQGSREWELYHRANGNLEFNSASGGANFTIDGDRVITIADEGAGNGLDADTVDGLDAFQFLRSDVSDVASGVLTLNNTVKVADRIEHNGDTDTYMSFNVNDQWRVVTGNVERLIANSSGVTIQSNLILNGTGRIQGVDTVSASTDAANKQYVDDALANVGDADTLDGAHGNTAHDDFTGDEYVRRHSSGYIYSNFYNMTANDTASMPTQIAVETGNDGFLRWQTPTALKNNLETLGIDADTVDGLHATSFLRSDADDNASGVITLTSTNTRPLVIGSGAVAERGISFEGHATQHGDFYATHADVDSQGAGYSFHFDSTEASTNVIINGSGNFIANGTNPVWHSGNDGSGSGLDADTVDGLQASQFLRSDASDTFTNLNGSSITLGSGVVLSESTDRPDLLMIKSSTSTWGGLQISNSSNEFIGSFMGDGSKIGIYDDQNSDWAWDYTENAGHTFFYNGSSKLTVHSTGINVNGNINAVDDIYLADQILHEGDTNTYMQFHAADQWRVVTGGTERIEVNNNSMIVQHDLIVNGTFYEQSDEKVKENIKPLEARDLSTIKPVTYNKIDRPDTPEIGFIAQDVEKEYPELVNEDEDGIKSVNYSRMTAVLLQKVQELEENYERRISSLEARIEELEK